MQRNKIIGPCSYHFSLKKTFVGFVLRKKTNSDSEEITYIKERLIYPYPLSVFHFLITLEHIICMRLIDRNDNAWGRIDLGPI